MSDEGTTTEAAQRARIRLLEAQLEQLRRETLHLTHERYRLIYSASGHLYDFLRPIERRVADAGAALFAKLRPRPTEPAARRAGPYGASASGHGGACPAGAPPADRRDGHGQNGHGHGHPARREGSRPRLPFGRGARHSRLRRPLRGRARLRGERLCRAPDRRAGGGRRRNRHRARGPLSHPRGQLERLRRARPRFREDTRRRRRDRHLYLRPHSRAAPIRLSRGDAAALWRLAAPGARRKRRLSRHLPHGRRGTRGSTSSPGSCRIGRGSRSAGFTWAPTSPRRRRIIRAKGSPPPSRAGRRLS